MITEILLGLIALNTFIGVWQCHAAAKRNRHMTTVSLAWMRYNIERDKQILNDPERCPIRDMAHWTKLVDLLTDVEVAYDFKGE